MRGRTLVLWTLLAVLATAGFGWPAAAVLGAAAGVIGAAAWAGRTWGLPPRGAALAVVLGWALLLVRSAAGARFGALAAALGGLARVRGPARGGVVLVLALATLAVGAGLAWCAATVAAFLTSLTTVRARDSVSDRVRLFEATTAAPERPRAGTPAAPTP